MKRLAQLPFALCVLAGALPLFGFDCGTAQDCPYNGKSYHDGDQFPSQDGCNTCSCANGAVACTEKACAGQWFRTCGDPVCRNMHVSDPKVAPCTTQKVGDPCTMLGTVCDPNDPCNVHLECATTDPTKGPGSCPISRAKYKRDIAYLDGAELEKEHRALLDLKLATYRYRAAGPEGPRQLGFIIDDVGRGPSVNPDGESVNLYGYTSMAVAAIQAQQKEIDELKSEIASLKKQLEASEKHTPRSRR